MWIIFFSVFWVWYLCVCPISSQCIRLLRDCAISMFKKGLRRVVSTVTPRVFIWYITAACGTPILFYITFVSSFVGNLLTMLTFRYYAVRLVAKHFVLCEVRKHASYCRLVVVGWRPICEVTTVRSVVSSLESSLSQLMVCMRPKIWTEIPKAKLIHLRSCGVSLEWWYISYLWCFAFSFQYSHMDSFTKKVCLCRWYEIRRECVQEEKIRTSRGVECITDTMFDSV